MYIAIINLILIVTMATNTLQYNSCIQSDCSNYVTTYFGCRLQNNFTNGHHNNCCDVACNKCKDYTCKDTCKIKCNRLEKTTTPPTVRSRSNHNVTTVINLTNISNHTNEVNIPLDINYTNPNVFTIAWPKEKQNCCTVYGPPRCQKTDKYPYIKCFKYGWKECGPQCEIIKYFDRRFPQSEPYWRPPYYNPYPYGYPPTQQNVGGYPWHGPNSEGQWYSQYSNYPDRYNQGNENWPGHLPGGYYNVQNGNIPYEIIPAKEEEINTDFGIKRTKTLEDN